MSKLNLHIMLASACEVSAIESRLRSMLAETPGDGPFPLSEAGFGPMFLVELSGLCGEVRSLNLPMSRANVDALQKALDRHIGNQMRPMKRIGVEEIIAASTRLRETLVEELKLCSVTVVTPDQLARVSGEHGFDEATIARFPAIAADAADSAAALGYGLWTATVMHAMRIAERGVEMLSQHVNAVPKAMWGEKLGAIREKVAGKSPDRQWVTEATSYLEAIKDGFRNPAMHPEMSFDRVQAERAFSNTAAFMRLLAKRLPATE